MVPNHAARFALEEGIGAVPVHVEAGERPKIWLRTPPITFGDTYQRDLCARALHLETSDLLEVTPQVVSAGNPTVFIAVRKG